MKEFFNENHYHFTHSFAFDPVLNDGLRKALEQMPAQVDKKKQILVYGRPGTERKAFNLVVAALKKWVMMQPDIEEWEILSAGEMHRSIPLETAKSLSPLESLQLKNMRGLCRKLTQEFH